MIFMMVVSKSVYSQSLCKGVYLKKIIKILDTVFSIKRFPSFKGILHANLFDLQTFSANYLVSLSMNALFPLPGNLQKFIICAFPFICW